MTWDRFLFSRRAIIARSGTVEALFDGWDRAAFGVVCRRLEILLARGEHQRAVRVFGGFVARDSPARPTMASPVVDVFHPSLAGMLEKGGYLTLEACRRASDDELREVQGLGLSNITTIRETVCCVEAGEPTPYIDDTSDLAPDWPPPMAAVQAVCPVGTQAVNTVKEALQLLIKAGDTAVKELDQEIEAKEREIADLRRMRRMLAGEEVEPSQGSQVSDMFADVVEILEINGPMRPSRLAKLAEADPSEIARCLRTFPDKLAKGETGLVSLI